MGSRLWRPQQTTELNAPRARGTRRILIWANTGMHMAARVHRLAVEKRMVAIRKRHVPFARRRELAGRMQQSAQPRHARAAFPTSGCCGERGDWFPASSVLPHSHLLLICSVGGHAEPCLSLQTPAPGRAVPPQRGDGESTAPERRARRDCGSLKTAKATSESAAETTKPQDAPTPTGGAAINPRPPLLLAEGGATTTRRPPPPPGRRRRAAVASRPPPAAAARRHEEGGCRAAAPPLPLTYAPCRRIGHHRRFLAFGFRS